MATATEKVTGNMDVDVVFVLYNSKGLKAQDVLDGATPEGTSFTWENFIQASLMFVWNEKYPGGKTEGENMEGLVPLQASSDTSLRGADGDESLGAVFDEDVHHEVPSGFSPEMRPQGHTLDLKLDGDIELTGGVDIDCPSNVPPMTVSGNVNICQRFTATLNVHAEDEFRSLVWADVDAAYDEAMKDGTMTKMYNSIDAFRVFRVPGHSHCELYYNKSDCQSAYSQRAVRYEDHEQKAGAVNMGALGGILLLFAFLGIIVYKKRALSNRVMNEVSEEQEKEIMGHSWERGTGDGSELRHYELTSL